MNIHNYAPTKASITLEPIETLKKLAVTLELSKNTNNTLIIHDKKLKDIENNDSLSFKHRIEIAAARDYFKIDEARPSPKNSLIAVNQLLFNKIKLYQDPKHSYDGLLAAQNTNFSTPDQKKIDISITQFFYKENLLPSAIERKFLVDLCIGLFALQQLGLSIVTRHEGKNGTISCSNNDVGNLIKTNALCNTLKKEQLIKLLNVMSQNTPDDLTNCSSTYEQVSSSTKSELLKIAKFIEADLNLLSLTGPYFTPITIGDLEGPEEIHHQLNYNEANIANLSLNNIDISQSSFSNANLTKLHLTYVTSENVNYANATLNESEFYGVVFSDCDFSGAELNDIFFDRVDFTNADLTRANISLNASKLKFFLNQDQSRDMYINHLNNEDEGLLVSINSINSRHQEQKISLMKSVIDQLTQLNDSKLAGSLASLADVFLKEPCYSNDSEIARFIQTRLLPQWMSSKNQAILRADEVSLPLVLKHLNTTTTDWSAREYQGVINQLLCTAASTADHPELQQAANKLRNTYLLSPATKEVAKALEQLEKDLPQETYIFTSNDNHQAVALDPELFKGLISIAPGILALTNGYLLERTSDTEPYKIASINNTERVYAIHPLLKARYDGMNMLIRTEVVGKILTDPPYSHAFIEALSQHKASYDLVTHQSELYTAFTKHWQIDKGEVDNPKNTTRYLLSGHQEQIWQSVKGLGLEDTKQNRAAVMLVLSSVFTRYSSSYMFGTEDDSPTAVRLYASALLNEACRLDPALIDKHSAKDWQIRLLGIGEAFTCTAVLSDIINEYVNAIAQPGSPLERASAGLYPAAWR